MADSTEAHWQRLTIKQKMRELEDLARNQPFFRVIKHAQVAFGKSAGLAMAKKARRATLFDTLADLDDHDISEVCERLLDEIEAIEARRRSRWMEPHLSAHLETLEAIEEGLGEFDHLEHGQHSSCSVYALYYRLRCLEQVYADVLPRLVSVLKNRADWILRSPALQHAAHVERSTLLQDTRELLDREHPARCECCGELLVTRVAGKNSHWIRDCTTKRCRGSRKLNQREEHFVQDRGLESRGEGLWFVIPLEHVTPEASRAQTITRG